MAAPNNARDLKGEELAAIVRDIQERVRARHPQGQVGGVLLPDLMPIVHARDAAMAKVAAIGTVNPRAGGLVNTLVQSGKRMLARLLDWHVREQVEFNRAVVSALESVLDALSEQNRLLAQAAQAVDVHAHWVQWREEWERKLAGNEIQFLRSVADLQAAYQHRVTLMEMNFREIASAQHADFTSALDRSRLDIQQRLWADMERVRADYDRLIHSELRMIRQRVSLLPPGAPAPTPGTLAAAAPAGDTIDWLSFASRFRGSEEYVRKSFEHYVPLYAGCTAVLDIGCGRGEFLELLKRAGTPARGIDLSAESVAQCRGKGLEAEVADLFTHLAGLADAALDGIFCAQVIEHLPPERLPEMLRLCAAKLGRGGLLVLETPNPECLAIFATHFYLDPTHQRPVPPALVKYYLEEFGFGQIEVERLAPAVETMPSLATLPQEFRDAFFGSLDYSVRARKLS